MWILVAAALAREPEPTCAGRLYEGTLVEVSAALPIPGVTLTFTNPRRREHLTLCTDPPPVTPAAIGALLLAVGTLGYCLDLPGDEEEPCRSRRIVHVTIDDGGRETLRERFGTGDVRVTGSFDLRMGLDGSSRVGSRRASVTLLTSDPTSDTATR